jgi:hypothetical protein
MFDHNICVLFDGLMFQHTIGIPRGTYCAPLLDDLFLHVCEAHFLQLFLKSKDGKLAQTFNCSFRYIYDVLSLTNSRIGNLVYLIYQNELEVKDTTDTQRYSSYFNLHLEIDNGGRLKSKLRQT